jgi:ATP-dependent RNA helicase DDX10/DBP4
VAGVELGRADVQAFISYMRSVHIQKDKTVFKLSELPAEEYAASMGLPGAPQIKLLDAKKTKARGPAEEKEVAVVQEREVVGSDESDDEEDEEDEEEEGGSDEGSEHGDDASSEDDEEDEDEGESSDGDRIKVSLCLR